MTASYAQLCDLDLDIVECTLDGGETCPTGIPSFGVVNTLTPALGVVTSKPFVVWTPGETVCECYDCKSEYTWTPSTTQFRAQVCFRLGDSPPLLVQDSKTGNVTVSNVQVLSCSSPVACGCCGPTLRQVRISYSGRLGAETVNGPCGEATYANGTDFLGPYAWITSFTATYCWDPSNPCTLTLVAIEGNPMTPSNNFGPDAFLGPGSCDCETNVQDTCDHSYALFGCAPFTGDAATIYQLAGSPPMTLTCEECPCEDEIQE